MPRLEFLLTNPRLTLAVKKDSEIWTLQLDAKTPPWEGLGKSFKIFCGGEEYDGFDTDGFAIIEQRTSRNESQLYEQYDRERAEKVFEERPGYILVGNLHPEQHLRSLCHLFRRAWLFSHGQAYEVWNVC